LFFFQAASTDSFLMFCVTKTVEKQWEGASNIVISATQIVSL